jgi:hypothetical protein
VGPGAFGPNEHPVVRTFLPQRFDVVLEVAVFGEWVD